MEDNKFYMPDYVVNKSSILGGEETDSPNSMSNPNVSSMSNPNVSSMSNPNVSSMSNPNLSYKYNDMNNKVYGNDINNEYDNDIANTMMQSNTGLETVHTVTRKYTTEKNSNTSMYLIIGILGVLTIIVMVWFFFYSDKSNFEAMTDNIDPLDKCGWIVYTMQGCPWCVKQKEILSKNYPNFTGIKEGGPVSGFPTWYNTKTFETKPGFKPVEELSSMAKC